MSKIEVDAVEPQSGTSLTLGASGDTITIPAGAIFDSSAATTTLPTTVVTTTGTQTLSNKTIDATQLTDSTVTLAKLSATGTKDATTFLRGDNTFASAGGTNTPAFEAYLSSTQTVTNDTDVKIQFDTERFDTASCYDNATNYRFTPTTAGKYFCYTSLRGAPTSGTGALEKLSAGFFFNGSSYGAQLRQDDRNSNGTLASVTVTTVIDFNGTTDYLEVFGNVDVSSGTPAFYDVSTLFGAYKLIGV